MAGHAVPHSTTAAHDRPLARTDRGFNGLAAASITLGASAIVAAFFAFENDAWVGWLAAALGLVGLICGYMARRRDDTSRSAAGTRTAHAGHHSAARKWGIGVSCAGLALGILFAILSSLEETDDGVEPAGTRPTIVAD